MLGLQVSGFWTHGNPSDLRGLCCGLGDIACIVACLVRLLFLGNGRRGRKYKYCYSRYGFYISITSHLLITDNLPYNQLVFSVKTPSITTFV
jgi:hypothetical protein